MTEQPDPDSLRRAIHNYGMPLAAIALGSVLSIAFFMFALSSATTSLEREFEAMARLQASAIDGRIRLIAERTLAVLSLARVTSPPDAARLGAFATGAANPDGLEAVGWVPGKGGAPPVLAPTGALPPGITADVIVSSPEVSAALGEAAADGQIAISRPFALPPGSGRMHAAVVARLAGHDDKAGSAFGLFDVGRVLEADDSAVLASESLVLFDTSAPDLGRGAKGAAFSYETALAGTAGRWRVLFLPSPGYALSAIGWWTWGALAAGLVITALVGMAMFQQARQGLIVAAKVEAGTRDVRLGANHLQAVFDTVVDGLITIDQRGIVKGFNVAAERIFGYGAEEVVGRNVSMLMPEPFGSGHDTDLASYLSGGEPKIIGKGREVSARRKDGSVFPMELGVNMFEGRFGRSFVGIIRDISERKAAEGALNESRQRTQAIIDHALDAIITIDRRGIISEWNAQAEAIFGWPANEALGRTLSDLIIPPEFRDAHWHGIARFVSKGVGPILNERLELPALTRLGKRITVDLAVTAQRLDNAYSFTGFLRDITARKAAEVEREALVADLKRTNQELDDIAYVASHDLKESLRGFSGAARLLQDEQAVRLDDEGKRRFGLLGALAERMELLVNDLFYFSRLGRQELVMEPTDLNAVVNEVATMMEPVLRQESAEIVVPLPLPTAVCDRAGIAEVFRHLIANGVKYNDSERKTVEVGYLDAVKTDAGDITDAFYVRDNGVGIEAASYSEIFQIFRRLDEGAGARKPGGVGLTFVKKIVERHGGQIWLQSAPGKGTTFYFSIKPGRASVRAA